MNVKGMVQVGKALSVMGYTNWNQLDPGTTNFFYPNKFTRFKIVYYIFKSNAHLI